MKSTGQNLVRSVASMFSGKGLRRMYPVRILTNPILDLLRREYVHINGHRFHLDQKDSLSLSFVKEYEPLISKIFCTLIHKGDIIVDIGANIGYHTLNLAHLTGPTGRVYAFEPDQTNFRLLVENVNTNNYQNVVCVRSAVSDKNGFTQLSLSKWNSGDHRIYHPRRGGGHSKNRQIQVETVALDNYFKEPHGDINLIKMDIQGAEALALRGMSGLLRRYTEVKLISEFSPFLLSECGIDPEDYLRSLCRLDFKLYDLDVASQKILPTTPYELMKTYANSTREKFTDLLCTRQPLETLLNS